MFGKVENNPTLTLVFTAAIFLIFGYATSLPKITDFMIFCIFVIGFDLLYGHMGQLSFGHMLYLGAGAYGCGMFAYHIYPDPFLVPAGRRASGGSCCGSPGTAGSQDIGCGLRSLELGLERGGSLSGLEPLA